MTYNPNPLHPRILINDLSDATVYEFVSEQLDSTPTQDFLLESFSCHIGKNDDYGYLTLRVHDHNGVLMDTTTYDRPSSIGRELSIQLYLGKSLSELQRWFYGKIKDVQIERTSTGLQLLNITCVGYGIILKERLTRLVRNQAKTSDGITLDTTDTTTRIDNLLLDLFNATDHYVDDNIDRLTSITATTSTTGNGICEDCTAITLANVNYNLASFAQVISDLVNITNADWSVSPDNTLIVNDAGSHDSGFLFTNNINATRTTSWDSNKLGYILNAPIGWQDSSADTLYNFIHGFGHFSPSLNTSDGQTPDAADNLDTAWHAIPFKVTSDNIFKIAVQAIKTGTPASDSSVQIWGDSGGSGADSGDVRRKILLNSTTLNNLPTATPSAWFEIPIKPKLEVTPNEQLYIVFPKYGSSTNTYNINYKTGTGTYWDSSDGVTWTSRTGQSAFRVYEARRLISTLENTEATKYIPEPRERAFPIRADLEEQTVRQTLIQAGSILGKQRRTYTNVKVTPVSDRIPLNHFCLLEDSKTGLLVNANINGINFGADSTTLGVQSIELELDSFHY